MKYDLLRPCPNCPFRTDIPGYLRPERAMTDDEILAAASNQDGSPRFYVRGHHPATFRLRQYGARIKALLPDTPERQEMLDYIDRKVEEFEVGEDRARLDYLRAAGSDVAAS